MDINLKFVVIGFFTGIAVTVSAMIIAITKMNREIDRMEIRCD